MPRQIAREMFMSSVALLIPPMLGIERLMAERPHGPPGVDALLIVTSSPNSLVAPELDVDGLQVTEPGVSKVTVDPFRLPPDGVPAF